jgi:arylsulfatase A-like enzyme
VRNQVLKNILRGTLNSDLAHDSSFASHLISIAKFIQNNPEKNKFFLWGTGCPSHATVGALGSTKKELERFLPRYNECIKFMEEQLEIAKANSNAIIIYMSDHGGFFIDDGYRFPKNYDFNKVNYMKYRDVFGAFMAIRWPNREKAEKYDSDFNVVQDLFPIVFSYLFDSEIPLKYKIKNTELRIGNHKFDKGVFYQDFYSGDSK